MQLMLTWGCFGETALLNLLAQLLYTQQVIKKPNEYKEDNTKSNVSAQATLKLH